MATTILEEALLLKKECECGHGCGKKVDLSLFGQQARGEWSISHLAAVAVECLPLVAGAREQYRSGDTVLVDYI